MVGIGRAITGVPVAAPGARDFLHVAGLQPPVDATTLGEDSRHKRTIARTQDVRVGSALILKERCCGAQKETSIDSVVGGGVLGLKTLTG